jgi:hypothetical protein
MKGERHEDMITLLVYEFGGEFVVGCEVDVYMYMSNK